VQKNAKQEEEKKAIAELYKNVSESTPKRCIFLHVFAFILIYKYLFFINLHLFAYLSRGGEGNRTPVQAYPSKAFYMLITALIVGK
jgi:hypothetical protein